MVNAEVYWGKELAGFTPDPERYIDRLGQQSTLEEINHTLFECNASLNVATLPLYELKQQMEAFRRHGTHAAVLDYDGFITLVGHDDQTGRDQNTVWQEVKTLLGFSPEKQAEMYEHYKRWGQAIDYNAQVEWSDATYGVYRKVGVSEKQIRQVADQIIFRPGAETMIHALQQSGHEIAFISYGIKDIIERTLENRGITGITVFADQLEYDEAGIVKGAQGQRVVGANKGLLAQRFLEQLGDNDIGVFGAGDGIHDLDMLTAVKNGKGTGLGLYFHHNGYRGKAFDYSAIKSVQETGCVHVVSFNHKDTSLTPVNKFLVELYKHEGNK